MAQTDRTKRSHKSRFPIIDRYRGIAELQVTYRDKELNITGFSAVFD